MDIKEPKEKNIPSYYKVNNHHNLKLMFAIFSFIASIILILPFAVKATSGGETSRENTFYIQVLNNAMPIVKTSVFNEEDLAEGGFSIKKEVLSLFNIDLNNPLALVLREIPSMYQEGEEGETHEESVIFNPFKLSEKDISIEQEQKLDLPDKTVGVYNPKLKKTLNKAKPEVLIYHTHTTESFAGIGKDSLQADKNICATGDALAKELEENYGISVIHDKTVHNAASYTQSYTRSGPTVDKYLKKYGDFKIIIDLHRDSVPDKKAVTTRMNGQDVNKIMFVMSKTNPRYEKNLAVVNSLIKISDSLFPGYCRGILAYNRGSSHFHQNKSNNAVLIELGSYVNTIQEAKESTKYLGRIIAEYINGKK
ncbi:stage II sporulation protein P [Clostridium peptidivorans]|uniref:stage II sporulation protein P n=1 Tax=Clostridium peptidivorans TaxID=100174 RepID=UPI001FA8F34E|nr:stage II sporulation protein P [Clostridium peptidivorans]